MFLKQPHGRLACGLGAIVAVCLSTSVTAQVTNVADLVNAVNNGAANSTVLVGPGTFQLTSQLKPKAGMTIQGAGVGQTIITGASSWAPSTSTLPDPEITTTGLDAEAYLIGLPYAGDNITISDMTMRGPQLHGAVFGNDNDNLHLFNIFVDDFLYCGFRLFRMDGGQIHDCEFLNSGGRWSNGSPGVTGGVSGGAIFVTYMNTSEISNNRFTKTKSGGQYGFYGIKGRDGRRSRIHHNTINVNFSIEFPFENDQNMEIDHNICKGVISIPKYAGGPVPTGGYTFHIHHNYFTTSYAIEFVRNGVEIDHNLFDFTTTSDGGNLISGFGSAAAPGPAKFHNNLIKNPGRGVYWVNEIFNNIQFYNNHVRTNTTVTPRTEGLFGFNSGCTFSTITIKDNIIECTGQPRPLFRNTPSRSAIIENNTLVNVSDSTLYANPNTGAPRGLTAPLLFTCGVDDEFTVNGWTGAPTDNNGLQNFSAATITAYGTQDGSGSLPTSATVSNGGNDISLSGNSWKKVPLVYNVVAQTMMEFTVNSADTGEIVGIALDNDTDPTVGRRAFRFGGSDVNGSFDAWSWKINPVYISGSGLATYVVPVGTFFTGPVNHLGFIGDDDANGSTSISFSTVRIYDQQAAIVLSQGSIAAYGTGQDGQGGLPTSATVGGGGSSVTLAGNTWKIHPFAYTATAQTVMEFTVNGADTGEITGIALDNDTEPTVGRRAFRFGGSDVNGSHDAWSWKITPLYVAGSGAATYVVPVGSFFTGAISRIGFIGDDDANGSTNSTFSNIRIYQQ